MMVIIFGLHFFAIFLTAIVCLTSKNSELTSKHKYALAVGSVLFGAAGFSMLVFSDLLFLYKLSLLVTYLLLVFCLVRGVKNKYPQINMSRNILFDTLGLSGVAILLWTLGVARVEFDVYLLIAFLLAGLFMVGMIVAYLQLSFRRATGSIIDYPTVSVLVPARNEDHALQQCLSNLSKLDYPKLEVIVLDDCSQDKTSEIIAGYARGGVRFVQGSQPEADWTGKNHALQRLAEEASGDYLLFCDVDVRFGASAVTELINYVTRHELEMVSVMPARRHFDFLPSLFVYPYDQLIFLSSLLSQKLHFASRSCFVVRSEVLLPDAFDDYKNSVIPESFVARKTNHRLLLGSNFDVTTRKRISSIFETHIRLSYPLAFKSVTLAGLKSLAALLFVVILVKALTGFAPALVIVVMCGLGHIISMVTAGYKWSVIGLFGWLFTFFVRVILDVISMLKYEFGKVEWKSRNVCYPVLNRIPRLPKLED